MSLIRKRNLQIWLELFQLLVQRDLRVRYRNSLLGYLWSMMNPLLYMSLLTFVFSHIVKFEVKNFSLFLLSGIMSWNLFHQSMSVGVHSIVNNGALMKKVKVPNTIFPASCIGSVSVNFILSFIPYLLIALFIHHPMSAKLLLVPFVVLPYLIFTFACVLTVASLNVKFRDVGHVLEPLLLLVFYSTPIIYPITALPERYRQFLDYNPLSHYISAIRNLMFEDVLPSLTNVSVIYGTAALFLVVALLIYRRARATFIFDI